MWMQLIVKLSMEIMSGVTKGWLSLSTKTLSSMTHCSRYNKSSLDRIWAADTIKDILVCDSNSWDLWNLKKWSSIDYSDNRSNSNEILTKFCRLKTFINL